MPLKSAGHGKASQRDCLVPGAFTEEAAESLVHGQITAGTQCLRDDKCPMQPNSVKLWVAAVNGWNVLRVAMVAGQM